MFWGVGCAFPGSNETKEAEVIGFRQSLTSGLLPVDNVSHRELSQLSSVWSIRVRGCWIEGQFFGGLYSFLQFYWNNRHVKKGPQVPVRPSALHQPIWQKETVKATTTSSSVRRPCEAEGIQRCQCGWRHSSEWKQMLQRLQSTSSRPMERRHVHRFRIRIIRIQIVSMSTSIASNAFLGFLFESELFEFNCFESELFRCSLQLPPTCSSFRFAIPRLSLSF